MSGEENVLQKLLQGVSSAVEQGQGKSDWWQSFRFPETPSFCVENLMNCARSALFGLALQGGAAVRERTFESFDPFEYSQIRQKIHHYVADIGGRLVYAIDPIAEGEKASFFYVFSGGAILVSLSSSDGDTYTNLTIVGTSEAHMQLGQDLLNTCAKGKNEQVEA